MFNILRPLGALLRIKQINTSDIFFVMNTKLTTALFVLFSVLLSTKELFGKAIDCENEHMNEFCWTTGTFIYSNPKEGNVCYIFFVCWIKISHLDWIIRGNGSHMCFTLWDTRVHKIWKILKSNEKVEISTRLFIDWSKSIYRTNSLC